MSDISAIGLGFLEGLSLVASPCILPVLPIVLSSTVTGQAKRPYGIILGFILMFSGLTLFSRFLVQALHIDATVLRQVAFVILLLVGLFMLSERLGDGFARLFSGLGNWGHRLQGQVTPSGGFISGLLIGACIGIVWVPCSGPVLAAVLVQSIQQKTTLSGVLTLLAFSIGAGLPMLAIALGGQQVMKRLTWFKQHGVWVRKIVGAVIIATVILTSQDVWNTSPSFSFAGQTADAAVPVAKLEKGLPAPYPAPALTGLKQWFNSPPLTLASLKGKVVLVDFWTYSCINCIRTLPHITAWDAQYRKAGLVILGIHAPEFEFERNPNNVAMALKKYGIHYPVAMDNDLSTWSQFNNQYWPAHYLIDKTGKVVYTHFGEGEYDVTEHNIQQLLGVTGKNVAANNNVTTTQSQTPETYLGSARAGRFQGLKPLTDAQTYTIPKQLDVNHWALSGQWAVTREYIQAKQANASLSLHFSAKKVFLVLGSPKPAPVQLYLDGQLYGKPLMVTNHKLYTLLNLPKFRQGVITVKCLKPGVQAYAFTFEG